MSPALLQPQEPSGGGALDGRVADVEVAADRVGVEVVNQLADVREVRANVRPGVIVKAGPQAQLLRQRGEVAQLRLDLGQAGVKRAEAAVAIVAQLEVANALRRGCLQHGPRVRLVGRGDGRGDHADVDALFLERGHRLAQYVRCRFRLHVPARADGEVHARDVDAPERSPELTEVVVLEVFAEDTDVHIQIPSVNT